MGLRFFADQCVPYTVIKTLMDEGFEVAVLKEYLPKDSPDLVVIAKAQELDAILISLNGDFSDIVTYPPSLYKGIVSLQVRNHPKLISAIMMRLMSYMTINTKKADYAGKLLLVEAHRIRIRK